MISLQTKAYVGPDGTLSVKVPPLAAPTPEELDWPPGFFEATAGAWAEEPLERGLQGEYEAGTRG